MKKLLILLAIWASADAVAQDRLFTYTYQSTVLDKGQKELEVWTTLGTDRQDYYRGFDHRLEFEIGLGSKLQTAFYLNYGYSKAITATNGLDVLGSASAHSFSNEWKLKLTDPVANAIGSALYFEYGLAPGETELEGKIILDKQTGKLIQAFNLVGELEFEKEFEANGDELEAETEKELKLEWNYGISRKISNRWFAGVELIHKNTFEEGELEHSLFYAGPGFSYSGDGFWVNFTLMPQWTDFKSGSRSTMSNDGLQARLIFSYVF